MKQSFFESAPLELLERIFIYAQNSSLIFVSGRFYAASKSASVRAQYLFLEFRPDLAFDPQLGIFRKRPKLLSTNSKKSQLIICKLLDLGASPLTCNQHLFNLACSKGWDNVVNKLLSAYNIAGSGNYTIPWKNFISPYSTSSPSLYSPGHLNYKEASEEGDEIEFRSFSVSTKNDYSEIEFLKLKALISEFIKTEGIIQPQISINIAGGAALVQSSGGNQAFSILKLLNASNKEFFFSVFLNSATIGVFKKYIDTKSAKNHYALSDYTQDSLTAPINFTSPHMNEKLKSQLESLDGSSIIVKVKLHDELDINCSNGYPLRLAAELGYSNIISLLLSNGADPKIDDSVALRNSVLRGDINVEITSKLIEAGADIHAYNESCLLSACYRGDFVPTFMETFPKENYMSSNSSAFGGVQSLYQTRYSKISVMPKIDSYGKNNIQYSSKHTYLKTIKLLLDSGADISVKNYLPLVYAVSKGHYFTLKLLLSKTPDLTAPSVDPTVQCGDALIMLARKSGRQDIAQLILDYLHHNR
ncbi:putative ankyrin repeat protein L25 [Smittium culicis]|uniref:Putative ankyrin repeat protein L25 n=1 Tax=Smittium culicis TaxID=133412 RepID=A0A1R1YE91_9FUNG|nr:putative ankyrin repeat protein L25 [Smittium culicis]